MLLFKKKIEDLVVTMKFIFKFVEFSFLLGLDLYLSNIPERYFTKLSLWS